MKTIKCFGVLIKSKSGTTFIATDGKGAPAIFDRVKGARQFRDELAEHINGKGKVIPVIVTY